MRSSSVIDMELKTYVKLLSWPVLALYKHAQLVHTHSRSAMIDFEERTIDNLLGSGKVDGFDATSLLRRADRRGDIATRESECRSRST